VEVILVVFEKDGELELVLDSLDDIVKEEHAVAVLEGWPVLEPLGHAELVLEEVIDEVVVRVSDVVFVDVVEPVTVFVIIAVGVRPGVAEEDLDPDKVFVDVIVAVVVFVDVGDAVFIPVGYELRVPVVVLVEVLDSVPEGVSTIPPNDNPLLGLSTDTSAKTNE